MARFPHSTTRAAIERYDPLIEYKFYARTQFGASNTWLELAVADDWELSEKTNEGQVLKFNPINEDLDFSDEMEQANRMQQGAEVKLEATVDGVTEIKFFGTIESVDPDGVDFEVEVYCPFARWNTQGCQVNLEATRYALTSPVALVEITENGYGSGDNTVWGVSTAEAAAFYGANTGNPRRPWAESPVIIRTANDIDGDGVLDPVPPDTIQTVAESGMIQVMASKDSEGGDVVPATGENIEVYLEGTLDLGDVIKAIITTAKADGGTGGTSALWTLALTTAAGCTTTVIKITGGVRHLYPYHHVVISGVTRTIASRDLAADTITLSVALASAPAAGVAVSYDTLWIGLDLTTALWDAKDGSAMDFYQSQLTALNNSVVLRYNAAIACYELLRYQQAPAAEYALSDECRVTSAQPRSLKDLYTRVVVRGRYQNPVNLLRAASSTLPNSGAWALEVYKYGKCWRVYETHDDLWVDGDANTGFGYHDNFTYDWHELNTWDLGSLKRIRGGQLVAVSSERDFPYGYWVQCSADGVTWFDLSSKLYKMWIKPADGVELSSEDVTARQFRYVRLMVFPQKDHEHSAGGPLLGLANFALYEDLEYTAIAQVQDTDAGGAYLVHIPTPTYTKSIPTYYPLTLQRFGGVHRTAPPRDLGDTLNEVKGRELAYILLDASLRQYQAVKFTHVADPYVRIGDTVSAEDPWNGTHTIYVESISLTKAETIIEGTNYTAEGLG